MKTSLVLCSFLLTSVAFAQAPVFDKGIILPGVGLQEIEKRTNLSGSNSFIQSQNLDISSISPEQEAELEKKALEYIRNNSSGFVAGSAPSTTNTPTESDNKSDAQKTENKNVEQKTENVIKEIAKNNPTAAVNNSTVANAVNSVLMPNNIPADNVAKNEEKNQKQYKIYPLGYSLKINPENLRVGQKTYYFIYDGNPVYLSGIETLPLNFKISNYTRTENIGMSSLRFYKKIANQKLNCFVNEINIISGVKCKILDLDIAQIMILEGYGYSDKHKPYYLPYEKIAKEKGNGMWKFQENINN